MDIRVLSKRENELELRIAGETHSLMNLLKVELLNDEQIDVATYDIKHTTIGDPVLFVRTVSGRDPIDAVIEASQRIDALCEDFKEAFERVEPRDEG